MKIEKIRSYIGFAIRSGKIIYGIDYLLESKKKPKLVLICSTQNEKVSNKVIKFCNDNNIKVYKFGEIILKDIMDRNCKVVGILDINLSNAILKELEMENTNN